MVGVRNTREPELYGTLLSLPCQPTSLAAMMPVTSPTKARRMLVPRRRVRISLPKSCRRPAASGPN